MGSGSSKGEKRPEAVRSDARKEKPVANVNKDNPATSSESTQKSSVQNTFITQPEDSSEDRNNTRFSNSFDDSSRSKNHDTTRGHSVWNADWETQQELNEVLQIPTDNKQFNNKPVHPVNPVRQVDLPETYAQRKQREQYTLNQQMLLRQKTIYRNPDDWKEEEEEEVHSGFDPSRFRTANKGTGGKGAVFTPNAKEGTLQYVPGQQNMDDFDITSVDQNRTKELPVYNASEQDLMASLERELMY